MKNINIQIKNTIFTGLFAMFMVIAIASVPALAQVSTGDAGSTAGPGSNSTPSTGDSGSTAGTGDSSSGSGESSGGRRGGGSRTVVRAPAVDFTNIVMSRASTNTLRITWNTSIPTNGKIVLGTASVTKPISSSAYHGYETGSEFESVASQSHQASFFLLPGQTYYVRLVAFVGKSIVFGPEISVVPTYDNSVPRILEIDSNDTESPAVIDLSKVPTSTDTTTESEDNIGQSQLAGVISAIPRVIGDFFSSLWNMLFPNMCRI
jgi:hypothetical protein